jgi:hypothetical protein
MKFTPFTPKAFPLTEKDYVASMRDALARLDLLMNESIEAWYSRKPNPGPEDAVFLETYRQALETRMELLGLFPPEMPAQSMEDLMEYLTNSMEDEDWDDDEDPETPPTDSRANLKVIKGPNKRK